MAKVKFSHSVRYNGERIPAHVPFSVKDSELDALKVSGAIIVEMTPVVKAPVISKPSVIPPPVDETPAEGPGDLPDESDDEQLDLPQDEKKEDDPVDLAKLAKCSVAKLKEFAASHKTPIPDNDSKTDIFNAISTALR
jgi:hypothetical protein